MNTQPTVSQTSEETIAGEFKRLDGQRQTRIDASEQFAYYTIPSVFPAEDRDDNTVGVGMLDSIGSAVVNHFANKLVTTLFSPNRPFFRLVPDNASPEVKRINAALDGEDVNEQEMAQEAMDDLRKKFSDVEKDSVRYLEKIGYRTCATNAAKLLIITGDVVIRSTRGKKSVAYSMRDYVCQKDIAGEDVVLIVRDAVVFGALPPKQQDAVRASAAPGQVFTATSPVVVYTKLELQVDGRYKIMQAIDNHDLPDSEKVVTKKDSPFTHLSWNLYRGENYGRGLVEDFAGSFHMINEFTNFQAKLGAKLADMKILVDPASGIDIEQLNTSDTGTYVAGKPGDVQNMTTGVEQSMQGLEQIIMMHKRQIAAAFLYQSGQTRDAERVTAEEIRENAAELEIAHGGVYSRFASDWQAKVATEAVAGVGEDMGDVVEPQIMTGMDSLSRTGEMQAVRIWLTDLSLLNQLPEATQATIEQAEFAQYCAIQRGVDHGAFVKSQEKMVADEERRREEERAALAAQEEAKGQAQAANQVAQSLG